MEVVVKAGVQQQFLVGGGVEKMPQSGMWSGVLLAVGSSLFLGCLLESQIFVVRKAVVPKNGLEYHNKSIGAIRPSSLAT